MATAFPDRSLRLIVAATVFLLLGIAQGVVAAPAHAAGGNVSGRLFSQGSPNLPLEGAGVSLFDFSGTQVAATGGYLAGGYFFLNGVRAGSYHLQIDSRNISGVNSLSPYWGGATSLAAAPVVVVADGGNVQLGDIVVPSGASISGHLEAASGPGNLGSPFVWAYDSSGLAVREARFDGDNWVVTGLWPGAYRLQLGDRYNANFTPEFWDDKASLAESDWIVLGEREARTNINATLQQAASVSGTVVGLQGGVVQGVSGVDVQLWTLDGSSSPTYASTDGSGNYKIAGVAPGTYRVRFIYNGNHSTKWAPQWWGNVDFAVDSTPISVGIGQQVQHIDATVAAGGSISGTVSYNPVPNYVAVTVWAYILNPHTSNWEVANLAVADSSGHFSIPALAAGTYTLKYAETSGNGWRSEYWNDAPTRSAATQINLSLGQNLGGFNAVLSRGPNVVDTGGLVSLAPARLLDTRIGNGAPVGAVGPGGVLSLQVAGRGGVPSSGVSAVVLNVTVAGSTAAGFITAYADGTSRPTASNLNFVAGQVVPNLVVVPVGANGKVALYNGFGSTHLVADVAGYYLSGTPAEPGSFVSLAPARLLDTRIGNGAPVGAVAPGGVLSLQVTGRGGVPSSGVSAVVLNVTVAGSTAANFVTAYADGAARPTASNLNFVAGQVVPNLVVVPVGANGKVALYNGPWGSTQLVADVAGYYLSGTATEPGTFVPLDPARLLDTRTGTGTGTGGAVGPLGAVAPGGVLSLQVAGREGVPPSGVSAVVLNVTVAGSTAANFVTAYADGASRPTASNLNFVAGQVVPNLVVVPVGANGKVALYNGPWGSTHLVADVAGYYLTG